MNRRIADCYHIPHCPIIKKGKRLAHHATVTSVQLLFTVSMQKKSSGNHKQGNNYCNDSKTDFICNEMPIGC